MFPCPQKEKITDLWSSRFWQRSGKRSEVVSLSERRLQGEQELWEECFECVLCVRHWPFISCGQSGTQGNRLQVWKFHGGVISANAQEKWQKQAWARKPGRDDAAAIQTSQVSYRNLQAGKLLHSCPKEKWRSSFCVLLTQWINYWIKTATGQGASFAGTSSLPLKAISGRDSVVNCQWA